ncbi:MAG: endonuclease V [Candidatus Aminicenantes bacterium]
MDLKKAAQIQSKMSASLDLRWPGGEAKLVAGADFSYDAGKKRIGSSIVVLKIPDMEIVEKAEAVKTVDFPYIPSYLAFREAPCFFAAFAKIKTAPDVTLIDGNGIAHPRKMGLASYVGILMNISTIGCAKTPFYPFVLPGTQKGDFTFIKNEKNEKVGTCLRTRTQVKPLFVSPGNRIDLRESTKIVLQCSKFRVPEPLRKAHEEAGKIFPEK